MTSGEAEFSNACLISELLATMGFKSPLTMDVVISKGVAVDLPSAVLLLITAMLAGLAAIEGVVEASLGIELWAGLVGAVVRMYILGCWFP